MGFCNLLECLESEPEIVGRSEGSNEGVTERSFYGSCDMSNNNSIG